MSAALVETVAVPSGVSVWARYPAVYEINTWVWLAELSQKHGRSVDLSSVPAAEWNAIAAYGFDGVWLMGVWERSPVGTAIANQNTDLLDSFQRALPDFQATDNVGSPYCVRRYVVDEHLGGPDGLATARCELFKRGMNLILDFVPNHVAPDHPWVHQHPEYFICGNGGDVSKDPFSFIELWGTVFACGRDPYFPAWPDVLQLNAFEPGLRQAAIETVASIAEQCDGVRCDMAMLFLNPIFERTWDGRAGPPPATEYWVDVISAIKQQHPGFVFIAEAYWDLEWELQQKGFDFCYDKTLYDRLAHNHADSIRLHLCADLGYQGKLLRFIENHDEPRAAATLLPAKQRAAALTIATLPGIKLFHEGQFEGRKVRLPVFLGRRPDEPVDHDLQQFYMKLLDAIDRPIFHDGEWRLCERTGWPDNASFQNLVAWTWVKDSERHLIVVNLSDSPAQARVQVPWNDTGSGAWQLEDPLSGVIYERDSDELRSQGLYVDLGPWNYHFFQCQQKSGALLSTPTSRAA
jgi:hypothetical protein